MANNILLGKTKRRGARNETNKVPIDIKSTFKPAIIKDVKKTIDLYDVYREEYGRCDKFRITLTIKPYCTNVLFNVCSEIVKNEGSENCYSVCDNESAPRVSNGEVYGRLSSLYRNYMVSNSEYSSPEIGYKYYPGIDIFDNHTLRSLSFRPIMKMDSMALSQNGVRNVFNTVRDFMRTEDGEVIEFFPRFSMESIENNKQTKMHVYDHNNLLSFIDGSSTDANLTVINGWYGFYNASSINSNSGGNTIGSLLDNSEHIFNHTINNIGNCEFVDMFPDRSRYSFIPIYNQHRNRYEKNWDIFLTYPWKNYYNHNLVRNLKSFNTRSQQDGDGNTYALATMRVQWTRVSTNRNCLLFRSFCKHGVSVNDRVAIYLSKDCGVSYVRLPRVYKVDYIGDVEGKHSEYFFGISTKTLLNDIFAGSIENAFYNTYNGNSPVQYTVSNAMTEVPLDISNNLITVYTYEIGNPNNTYDASSTLDEYPKTVNSASMPHIRVWDKSYIYMSWAYNSETDTNNDGYVESAFDPSVNYGTWNTFTDIPTLYVKDNIRVKKYDYYRKVSKTYCMKTDLLNGNTTISDIINGVFTQEMLGSNAWNIRFVKVTNDTDCQYYIRQFKKIPNLKNSEEPITDQLYLNPDSYENFIERNATDEEGRMLELDSETYKLAFSKTIYGDDVAQVTFLDDIKVDNLKDNLGRPVTEIYSTIVKRNAGYRIWYENMGSNYSSNESNLDTSKVEFSRCFGSLTTGFEYLDLDDIFDREENTRIIKGMMSSVTSIYKDDNQTRNIPLTVEDWDSNNRMNAEITDMDNVFFGDVVEYDPYQCKETILSDACFRFNTAQREIGDDSEGGYFDFTYTELEYDDFDPSDTDRQIPFQAVTYKQWLQNEPNECVDTSNIIGVRRKEGYYYKPHSKVPLYRYTDNILQGSHRTLQVKDCCPMQVDGIFIKITTLTMHGVSEASTVYICYGNNWYSTSVSYVIDRYSFAIKPINKEDSERNGMPYIDWVTICENLISGGMKARVKNDTIPPYASRVGENLFLWRNIINPVELPITDVYRHPFSNNAFYVDAVSNVYLMRQDPFGVNGLFKGEIGEIEGKPRVEPNNKYKQPKDIKCY